MKIKNLLLVILTALSTSTNAGPTCGSGGFILDDLCWRDWFDYGGGSLYDGELSTPSSGTRASFTSPVDGTVFTPTTSSSFLEIRAGTTEAFALSSWSAGDQIRFTTLIADGFENGVISGDFFLDITPGSNICDDQNCTNNPEFSTDVGGLMPSNLFGASQALFEDGSSNQRIAITENSDFTYTFQSDSTSTSRRGTVESAYIGFRSFNTGVNISNNIEASARLLVDNVRFVRASDTGEGTVPEPSSLILMLSGLLGFAFKSRNKT